MNTLWVFGDSFSYGTGINFQLEIDVAKSQFLFKDIDWDSLSMTQQEEYVYKYSPNSTKFKRIGVFNEYKTWADRLADHYSCKLENHAYPGYTHEQILKNLLKFLPSMKAGDKVVIGTTRGQRMWVPIGDFHKGGSKMGSSCALDVAFEHEDQYRKNGTYDYSQFTKEQHRVLVDYRYSILSPKAEVVEEEWKCIFNSLLDYLLTRNITGICWGSNYWEIYESFDRSNYGIQDGHWTPKGNKDFYIHILNELEGKALI